MTEGARSSLVLYLGPDEGWSAAKSVIGDLHLLKRVGIGDEELRIALPRARAIIDASTWLPIGDDALDLAPNLRVISCASTGSAHIDTAAARARGISVRTLRENEDFLDDLSVTAELTWALLLACARRIVPASRHVAEGRWDRTEFPGVSLLGRRLGVIGFGRLGRWMARYGAAFGMDVVASDPNVHDFPSPVRCVTLDELVHSCDVVSLHVHASEATRHLLDRTLLEIIKPGAIVLNTSRGSVLDEDALLDGLRSGRIAAAALDVLTREPYVSDDPLVHFAAQNDRLLLTPHIGGFVPEAVEEACRIAAAKVVDELAVFEGTGANGVPG